MKTRQTLLLLLAHKAYDNTRRRLSVLSGSLARGRGVGIIMVPLLVCEPVSAVEQLLSRQPVVGYVTGLPADQVVRHDV